MKSLSWPLSKQSYLTFWMEHNFLFKWLFPPPRDVIFRLHYKKRGATYQSTAYNSPCKNNLVFLIGSKIKSAWTIRKRGFRATAESGKKKGWKKKPYTTVLLYINENPHSLFAFLLKHYKSCLTSFLSMSDNSVNLLASFLSIELNFCSFCFLQERMVDIICQTA